MKHLTNYTCPKRQRRCIFILLLVPIYALTAAIGCSVALLLVPICAPTAAIGGAAACKSILLNPPPRTRTSFRRGMPR